MNSESVKPDYTSIASVLQDAQDEKLLLPEFQRPFVWTIEQSKDLFDSLIRGIFIGTFVLAKPQFDLSCRAIDTRPRVGKGSRAKVDPKFFKSNEFEGLRTFVVLDGQQRITSLYRVLKGNDKIYFIFKKPSDIPAPNEEIKSIEQIVDSLSIKPIEDSFSVELSEVFKCATWKEKDIQQKVFEPALSNYKYLKDSSDLTERYLNLLVDLKRLFSDLILDKTLLSVFFLNMGIEKFCMFFERSNSKGTELSFIDIITAKIYKDFKLDKSVREFKNKYKSVLFDDSIVEAFVRYMAYLKRGQVDRKTILTYLDGSDFTENWKLISELYVKCSNFLVNQKLIYRSESVTYKTMFIPIIHFLKNLPHRDFSQITQNQMKLFKFWFWGSLLNTRYGGGMVGSTNDIIVDDCKKMESIANGGSLPKEYLKQYKFDYKDDDLLDLTSNGAIFTGIMSIMNFKNGLRNLGNHLVIDFKNSINIHHIFPSKYLEKNFDQEEFENEYSDCILNKMITEKIPNIKFGEKKPSQYLSELKDNPKLCDSLETHCISQPGKLVAGLLDHSFKEFAKARAKRIIDLIDSEVGYMKLELIDEIERSNLLNS